jgi:hypothetical protein
MSKKKSYMDKENILSEGILKMLGKLIPFKKLMKKAFKSKEGREISKSPGLAKALRNFDDALDNIEVQTAKARKLFANKKKK